jgi:hypothetical protein
MNNKANKLTRNDKWKNRGEIPKESNRENENGFFV